MGAGKEWMMDQDDKRAVAEEIAVRVGLLERCEDHGYLVDPLSQNFQDAYAYGNSLITKNDPLVDLFGGDRRQLTDLIQDVTSGHGTECPGCESRNDD